MKQINRIINDIQFQDQYTRMEILEKLVHLIKRSDYPRPKREHTLLDLKGLGKEIWAAVDSNTYLEQERNSWA